MLLLLAYYLSAGLGVNLAYHRILSHRALRLPKWLERSLVLLGLPAGTPVQWIGNHRYHHAHTDTALDPHSPVQHGFWYAHAGWYFGSKNRMLCVGYALAGPVRMLIDAWIRPRTNLQHNALASDIAADPLYAWISRPLPYAVALYLHAFLPIFIAYRFAGARGIAAFWITLVMIYNLGDAIESVAHLRGARLPAQRDQSRNNAWLGILTLGEGWHANHHRCPRSARHGWSRGQLDLIWQLILLLKFAGLATKIQLPNEEVCR
jgi:fatty-acid desaturase